MSDCYEDKLCEIKDVLIGAIDEAFAFGVDSIDTDELGNIIDMVKDLDQANYYHCKSVYYKSITDAMGEGDAHVDSVIESLRKMWADADPTLRQKMRNDISSLMTEMN